MKALGLRPRAFICSRYLEPVIKHSPSFLTYYLKNYSNGSNVANNTWQNNHRIDFDNACAIYKGNSRVRKTLQSWQAVQKSSTQITTQNRYLGKTPFLTILISPHLHFYLLTVFTFLFILKLSHPLVIYFRLCATFFHLLKAIDWSPKAYVFNLF